VSRSFSVVGEITAQIFRDAKRITDVEISSPGGDIGLTLGMFDIVKSQCAPTPSEFAAYDLRDRPR
jgi:hypothetical protein